MRKRYFKTSKYENESFLLETVIQSIDYKNQLVNNQYKSVFNVKNSTPEGKMCVYWGRCNLDIGDKIVLKGRVNGEVILVWSYQIHEKAAKGENICQQMIMQD